MAVGDDAVASGFPLVPSTGNEDAKVRYGAREINRTRDFIAQIKALIPVSAAGYRTASGITSGSAAASGGTNGDVYYKVLG
jgi:hypothetical protein